MDPKPATSSQSRIPGQEEIAAIALSLRVPPFWRDKSRLWFISFEAATSELKKGQDQLAQMVIAQLEKQDIEQIADILCNPPPADLYDAIKTRLISVYEESDSRQLQKLLSEIELGDQKPTQLLRRMRFLAKDKVPDTTLRLMWSNHLPAHIRSVLAVSESFSTQTALDELALLADKMLETSPNTQVAAVEAPTSQISSTDVQFLISEVSRLSLEVAELRGRSTRRNYRHPFRSRSRSLSRPAAAKRSQLKPGDPTWECRYHFRYGSKARRCESPCCRRNKTSEN